MIKEAKSSTSLPDQRVSKDAKLKEDHYIPTIDYWVAKATSHNNKKETIINLNAANGIVDESTYDYVLNPLTYKLDGESIKVPGEMREIDIITPIKEKNIGEYIQLPYNYFVKVGNSDATLLKNDFVAKEFYSYLEQVVINLMNEQQETGVPSKELENPEEFVKKIKDAWFDDRTIQGQHILNNINEENQFDIQRVQSFFYWWATEQFYTYRYIDGNQFIRELVSPTEGFPISNGEQFVEDYDGFLIRRYITVQDLKRTYWDKLKKEDRDYLIHLDEQLLSDSKTILYSDILNILGRRIFKEDGVTELEANKEFEFSDNNSILEHIIIYKTENKHRILTYINELGNIVEREVEDDYELDEELGDIKVEDLWIEEVYKATRLGNEKSGIYLPPERELVQRYGIKGNVKLPVGGKRGLLIDNHLNPIPRRLIVYQGIIRFLNLQQERAIAKHKGSIMTIPESMLTSDKLDTKQQYFLMLSDGVLIYDDQEVDFSTVAQAFKVVENPGLERYIVALEELKRNARNDAWDVSNMNDARFGQSASYKSVRNNEQDLFRSKLGSELMIYMFNKALERDHIADLEYSKIAYIDGKEGSYFDKDSNEVKFSVDPNTHFNAQYGITVTNARKEEDKMNQYKEIAFAASQNGDSDLAAKAIEAENSVELAKYIEDAMEAKREYERYVQEQNAAIEQEKIKSIERKEELNRKHELDKITLEETLKTERELAIKEIELELETSVKAGSAAIAQAKLQLDIRKQAYAEKQGNKKPIKK